MSPALRGILLMVAAVGVFVSMDTIAKYLSQWYPVSDLLGPPEGTIESGPLDLAKVDRSFLEWEVDLLPRSGAAPEGIPAVAVDDPWALARNVSAAWMRTVPRKGPERGGLGGRGALHPPLMVHVATACSFCFSAATFAASSGGASA